jgi:ABC-type transporter Mla subunit MlaD
MSTAFGAGPRRSRNSVAANPVLIGAVTVLVVAVAVFISYNANSGLPFVPSYEVSVKLKDAAELVPGNDVRQGGSRVGSISKIRAVRTATGAYAVAEIKVEQRIGPLPTDTRVVVRQRSPLGLKYLEILPGRSAQTVKGGGMLANAGTPAPVDFDNVLDVFDAPTRAGLDKVVTNLGVGLAGRGGDLNQGLENLPAVFGSLPRVAANLADPATRLPELIRALDGTMVALAPVAPRIGDFLSHAATTFDALDDKPALQRLLNTGAATLAPIAGDLHAIPPVMVATNKLLARLRPGLQELPAASRTLAAALKPTTPALAASTKTFTLANGTVDEVGRTVRYPDTSTALRQLSGLTEITVPALTYINPFQVQCNYLGLWMRNVPGFISEGDNLGTWFRAVPVVQPEEILARATPAPRMHADFYPDAGQDGTCEAGNTAYIPNRQVLGPNGVKAPATTELTTRPPLGGTG